MTDTDAPEPTPTDAPDVDRRRAADEVTFRAERLRELSEQLITTRAELRERQRELTRTQAELTRLRGHRLVRVALAASERIRRVRSRTTGATARSGTRATPTTTAEAAASITPGAAASEGATGRLETPAAFRARFAAQVGGGAASSAPLRVGIVEDSAARDGASLAAALGTLGWAVTAIPADRLGEDAATRMPDVVVVRSDAVDIRTLPDGTVTVAWVVGASEAWLDRPWFDEFDLVVTASAEAAAGIARRSVHRPRVLSDQHGTSLAETETEAAAGLRDALLAWADAPRIDVAIGPPDWEVAPKWGDLHFGRALQRALQARGYPTRLRLRPAWSTPVAARADVAIHVFGLAERPTFSEQLSVLWIISHPDLVTDAMVARYDPVFVASDGFAAELARRTGRDIRPLHQATDPERFHPVPGGPAHELLFVANARRRRPIVDELTPTPRDLAVYGRNWTADQLDPRHLRGEHVPNDRLAAYYTAASIVLNDHWADMAEHGFLSNRLYDASASGAFVISDHAPGIEDEFDDGVVTYRDGAELRALVERYLDDPAARAEHARRARAAVLAAHTFEHRVDEILRVIGPRLPSPPMTVDANLGGAAAS